MQKALSLFSILFVALTLFCTNAFAEYYYVYQTPYVADGCGYGCATTCNACVSYQPVCTTCGYTVYQEYVRSPYRYYDVEQSYAQMNEYAWIP